MNEQNLRQFNSISKEEHIELSRKGGIASAEIKRKRKTLKDELLLLLEDGEIQKKISVALIQEAIIGNNAGSVTKAFETIRDTIGEKPIDKFAGVLGNNLEQALKEVEGDEY